VWRLVKSLAQAVLAAVLGPRPLAQLLAALPALERHLREPPRKRRLQMTAVIC
jgi:hypothetical protein